MSFNFRLPLPWSNRFLFLINFMPYLIPRVYFFLIQRYSFMALSCGEEASMPLNAKEKCWMPMRGHDVHVASKLQRVSVKWMDALKCHEIYRCISSRSQPGESRGGCLAAISRFIGGTFSRSIARPVDFQPGRPGFRMKNLQKGKRNVEILDREVVIRRTRTSSSRTYELPGFFIPAVSNTRFIFDSSPLCISWTVK